MSDRNSSSPADRPPATGAGIYRAIQWLLFLDVVLGLALAIIGSAVLEADSIAYAGLGLAVIGLLLMVFFRALAAREEAARRHAAEAAAHRGLRQGGGTGGEAGGRADAGRD